MPGLSLLVVGKQRKLHRLASTDGHARRGAGCNFRNRPPAAGERTNGELSARCDKEAANFLAINLADEVITGKRSPKAAREEYAKQIMAMMAGEPAPLTEKLLVVSMTSGTADPDKSVKMKK